MRSRCLRRILIHLVAFNLQNFGSTRIMLYELPRPSIKWPNLQLGKEVGPVLYLDSETIATGSGEIQRSFPCDLDGPNRTYQRRTPTVPFILCLGEHGLRLIRFVFIDIGNSCSSAVESQVLLIEKI